MEPFVLPESLASVVDLEGLQAQAVAAFDALYALGDDINDEQIAQLEQTGSDIHAIRAEAERRVTAAAERRERMAAARASVEASTAAPEEEPVEAAEDDEAETEETATEPEEAAVEDTIEETVTAAAPAPPAPVKKGVVAQMKKSPPALPKRSPVAITAGADIPGVPTGSTMDGIPALAAAITRRVQGFPRSGHTPGLFNRYNVATFTKEYPEELVAAGIKDERVLEVFETAARESRLPGGSLTAAGGWCAPSETFYDLCEPESLDGIIDLPEVQVNRGGIRFTRGPDFSSIYGNVGFIQTEAEAIAGTTKPCFTLDCPDFEEVRLDAAGICIQVPLLTEAGYPELVQRVTRGALVAYQHKVNVYLIDKMVDAAGAATTLNSVAGAGIDLLGAVEWVAEALRNRWRMSFGSTIEIVLPHWFLFVLRQDLSLRQGRTSPAAVTDAEINALFAARGVRVQWVTDWQDIASQTTPTPPAEPELICVPELPDTVQILAYPAGTFIKGGTDVISLDAVYDTTNLQKNVYTSLFFEEGLLVANRCFDACLLELPICIAGRVGGTLGASTCWTPVAATP